MSDSRHDPDWQAWLSGPPPPPPDPGFTLRVLTALPPTSRRPERLRARVLLLAVLAAVLLMAVTVMPALADPPRLPAALILCLAMAALAVWSVFTVAE